MRDELAARAALDGESKQAHLGERLERTASKQYVRISAPTPTRMPAEQIRRHVLEDRGRPGRSPDLSTLLALFSCAGTLHSRSCPSTG